MKIKDASRKTLKYLRELSIVVVGICITFGLNNWISNHNQQKDLKRYLELVNLELKDNLGMVEQQYGIYEHSGNFAKYLSAFNNPEHLNADSLARYKNVIRDIESKTYKTSAFEMLKSSGSMRLIKDKSLLKSIIDSYSEIERVSLIGDRQKAKKEQVVYDATIKNGLDDALFGLKKPEYRPLFNYFSIYTGTEGNYLSCARQIENTLDLFAKD